MFSLYFFYYKDSHCFKSLTTWQLIFSKCEYTILINIIRYMILYEYKKQKIKMVWYIIYLLEIIAINTNIIIRKITIWEARVQENNIMVIISLYNIIIIVKNMYRH